MMLEKKKTIKNDKINKGARVVMACRDMKACSTARQEIIDETFNKNVECMECDLASLESIRNFVRQLNESNNLKNHNSILFKF